MTILVGFDNGETIFIEDTCDIKRIRDGLQIECDKDTKFVAISDTIINLNKITFIKEYYEDRGDNKDEVR